MNKSKIIITFLIIAVLIFAGFSAYAAEDDMVTQENDAKILNEIVEKRTLSSKAYAMSDGTVRHELFATDIHYKDDKGNLKDIDIKVKDIDSAKSSGYKYKNGENSWDVYFADKGKAQDLVEVKQDSYSISFSIDNAKETAAAGKSTAMKKGKSELHDYYAEDPTVVIYSDIMDNVDLAYTIREKYLKEDIVLNAVPETNEFAFTITTKNLNVTLKDNKLEYKDSKTGETVFYTNNLFMEDSKSKISTDVSMKLDSIGNGKYKLTVIADEKFLKASDTVYPVIVDPTIQSESTYDVFVSSKMPTTNMNSGSTRMPYLRTGNDSDYWVRRSYIEFRYSDFSNSLPSGTYIVSAYLDLCRYSSSGSIDLRCYPVSSDWNSGSVTWNTKPGYYSQPYSTSTYIGSDWYRMDVKDIAADWHNGSYSYNGFLVKAVDESSTSIWATFRSSDNWLADERPKLILNTNNNYALSCWYCDKDEIGDWTGTPYVYIDNLSDSGFSLANNLSNAVTEWTQNGISVGTTNNLSNCDIRLYAGSYSELLNDAVWVNIVNYNTLGLVVVDTQNHQSISDTPFEHTWVYINDYKAQFSHQYIYMYVMDWEGEVEDTWGASNYDDVYTHAVTHELGHALGYRGHYGSGVMSNDTVSTTSMTETDVSANESAHLNQVDD